MTASLWTVTDEQLDPRRQHHFETVFTIGNGYLSTRGAFEEGYPEDRRATFIHGVFDDAPIVFTELANAPDWLPLLVMLDGEPVRLDSVTLHAYHRSLDLRNGVLTRTADVETPGGRRAAITWRRFASLADQHLLALRVEVVPAFDGEVEIRAGLHGAMTNRDAVVDNAHWKWVSQCQGGGLTVLRARTRTTKIEWVGAMRLDTPAGTVLTHDLWDAPNAPTERLCLAARAGQPIVVDKFVGVATSRDGHDPVALAEQHARAVAGWEAALAASTAAWESEWAVTDVEIEGDAEAQISLRFNLFQMLIAAPRHDEQVNIGAKTLSGFGYRGHCFWDTEIFMLPLFTYTAPHIARNLLNYRYHRLDAARRKAQANGFEGAQFPWESADTGEEVTPGWVPHFADRNKLIRIWPGDIEIHITADIAFAVHQYWSVTGDDKWFIDRGAELLLDTAKFWGSRAEWDAASGKYHIRDVIGPDEYHDHVDNNAFTNRMAQWNLQTALEVLAWLKVHAPDRAAALVTALDLTPTRLERWRDVIAHIFLHIEPNGLIEQFEGYFERQDVDLAAFEPRTKSMQEILGIEACAETQIIKQPDVLQLQFLLRDHYTEDQIRANYDYYNARTDHTYGSSLGPAMQAIIACWMGYPEDAYEHFMRAARADLRDVRGNAGDGIHAASAAGTWQSVVFGFAGLRVHPNGDVSTKPHLPHHWQRIKFKIFHRGKLETIEVHA